MSPDTIDLQCTTGSGAKRGRVLFGVEFEGAPVYVLGRGEEEQRHPGPRAQGGQKECWIPGSPKVCSVRLQNTKRRNTQIYCSRPY